jgi:hypothetical protein
MVVRTGKAIAEMHTSINGIHQGAAPSIGNVLQAGQPVVAQQFLAMFLLRATSTPAPSEITLRGIAAQMWPCPH